MGECTVGRDPVGRVVGFFQGVADAGMARSKDPFPCALEAGGIELQPVQELVHVAEDKHVGVKLDDAAVLGQAEGGEFGPAVVEAGVIGVVFGRRGEEVLNALFGDGAAREGGVPGWR